MWNKPAFIAALLLASASARAEDPAVLLSHQGRLLDGSDVPVNTDVSITVNVYASKDAIAPTWSETYAIHPVNGSYAILLGDTYGAQQKKQLPASVLKGDKWLGVTIGTTELLPRQRIGVAPQAISAFSADEATHAAKADVAKDLDCVGCVNTGKIATGAVTAELLGAGAVGDPALADGAVNGRAIAAKAIAENHLADGAVSNRALGGNAVAEPNLVDGAISTRTIAGKAVAEGSLADGAVSTRTIAGRAVAEGNLADGAISTRTIAGKAVAEGSIADGAISTRTIAGKAVAEAHFADQAVSTRALADGSVTPAKLSGNIDSSKLAANAVGTSQLSDGAVQTAKLADLGVTTGKLGDASVTAAKIADGTITAAKLAPSAAGTNENLLRDTLAFGAFVRGDFSGIGVNGSGGFYPWNYYGYDTAAVKVERLASNDPAIGDVRGAIGWDGWWSPDFTVLRITWGTTGGNPGRILQQAQNAMKNGSYTMSAYVRMVSGEAQMGSEFAMTPVRSTTWTRVTTTNTLSGTLGGAYGFAAKANTTGAVMLVALPKLESGGLATPWRDGDAWCPAPASIYQFGMCIWHVGNYDKTFKQASQVCLSQGGRICTSAELMSAWGNGAEWCSCGWTTTGGGSAAAYYPMQHASGGCGNAVAVNYCTTNSLNDQWGVNCCKTWPN